MYVFAFVVTEAVTIHVCSFTLQVVDTTIVMAQTSPMLFVQYMKTALISSGINMSGIKFPPSLRPPPLTLWVALHFLNEPLTRDLMQALLHLPWLYLFVLFGRDTSNLFLKQNVAATFLLGSHVMLLLRKS